MQSDDGKASGPKEPSEVDQEELKNQKAGKKNAKICYPHLSPRGNAEFFSAKNLMLKLKPEHASMFLFQRTYSMSDMFQFCPDFALEYSTDLEKVITTVPLRFSVVSERYDDATWAAFQQREFTYNRDEPIHRFISDSLRQQSHLDVLSGKSTT